MGGLIMLVVMFRGDEGRLNRLRQSSQKNWRGEVGLSADRGQSAGLLAINALRKKGHPHPGELRRSPPPAQQLNREPNPGFFEPFAISNGVISPLKSACRRRGALLPDDGQPGSYSVVPVKSALR